MHIKKIQNEYYFLFLFYLALYLRVLQIVVLIPFSSFNFSTFFIVVLLYAFIFTPSLFSFTCSSSLQFATFFFFSFTILYSLYSFLFLFLSLFSYLSSFPFFSTFFFLLLISFSFFFSYTFVSSSHILFFTTQPSPFPVGV